jgi:transposase
VPPVRGRVGRPRRRPRTLIADRGYDHDKYRRLVWQRGVKPLIARRQTEHGSRLGRHRWVVERTFAWLHNRRRLLVRTDRCDDIHEGFLAHVLCGAEALRTMANEDGHADPPFVDTRRAAPFHILGRSADPPPSATRSLRRL